ncbi:MAG TPA: HPP family protein [Opitutae bacterium]|nr:HPP family protein [Opitutae bacterium]HAF58676.1 HPP family protein [Opitutae bacterium]|tara:strand:- start:2865 stop:3407 length:543 start_codon:yes stop_codon:yes gene_type:complete
MAGHKISKIFFGAGERLTARWLLISWIGGFLGIFMIERIGKLVDLGGEVTLFLIGSFGASAVLAYGAPQVPFSQPRNIIGGHIVSALVGVSVFLLLGEQSIFSCPLAVSLAILAMQTTGTVHPPGGATALISVIGGSSVHQLGYWYVFCPVAVGAVIMVAVAWMVNNLSGDPKRKYPTSS